MPSRFTATDMLSGLVRVLSDRGYSSFVVKGDRLDAAFEAAYRRLTEVAGKFNLDVRFQIARDDFGESQILRMALNGAAQRDLVSFDNPEFQDMRLDRTKVSAVRMERIPGGRALFEDLADVFLDEYEKYVGGAGLPVTARSC